MAMTTVGDAAPAGSGHRGQERPADERGGGLLARLGLAFTNWAERWLRLRLCLTVHHQWPSQHRSAMASGVSLRLRCRWRWWSSADMWSLVLPQPPNSLTDWPLGHGADALLWLSLRQSAC